MIALKSFEVKIYTTWGVYTWKEINANMDCNTPGIPAEANAKFLSMEKNSNFIGKALMKIAGQDKSKVQNTWRNTIITGKNTATQSKADLDPLEVQIIEKYDKDYNVSICEIIKDIKEEIKTIRKK